LEIDFSLIKYLEEAVEAKQHKLIIAGIKKSWEDCFEKEPQILESQLQNGFSGTP
jgi:virulence-associated protein VagC